MRHARKRSRTGTDDYWVLQARGRSHFLGRFGPSRFICRETWRSWYLMTWFRGSVDRGDLNNRWGCAWKCAVSYVSRWDIAPRDGIQEL